MDRRFPFDQTGGRQPQMNPAQLRAALGLPPTAEDNFYLQQQHQHAVAQHDLQLRRFVQEQQLRSRGESIHDYPDLQHRLHRSLLINEQIAAQQLGGTAAQHQAAFLREQAKMHLQAEEHLLLMRQQQHQHKQSLEAAFLVDSTSQSATTNVESNQSSTQSKKRATSSPVRVETPTYTPQRSLEKASISRTSSSTRDEIALPSEHRRENHEQQIQNQREEQVKAFLASYNGQNAQSASKPTFDQKQQAQQQKATQQDRQLTFGRVSDDSYFPQFASKPGDNPATSHPLINATMKHGHETKGVIEMEISNNYSPSALNSKKDKKKRRTKVDVRSSKVADAATIKKKPKIGSAEAVTTRPAQTFMNKTTPPVSDTDTQRAATVFKPINDGDNTVPSPNANLCAKSESTSNGVGGGESTTQEQRDITANYNANENEMVLDDDSIPQKGTFGDILDVAGEVSQLDDAARILVSNIGMAELMSDSDVDSDDDNYEIPPIMPYALPVPRDVKTELVLPIGSDEPTLTYVSRMAQLPEEPVFAQDVIIDDKGDNRGQIDSSGVGNQKKTSDDGGTNGTGKTEKKRSSILEYPYPIDTWWPSISGMKKERRNSGESSDEDNFEESPSPYGILTCFRANEPKIRKRLSSELEPGVLEKLPHCQIHRIRTKKKKNSSAPELVYCWQVTELYPNDIMVTCSRCGTWRHAACGGHYKPYSIRDNIMKPFIPICDYCVEEERFLREYPVGTRRLERQRMEHLRRALATSAVMRHASFSKHGGTYKWPLGSVSATHIGGHIRSVHARHDKAEKQWTDMTTRLGRGGYGYRQKERIRSRTKEFERLLVSIEDAEGYTDRHNMILFLQRDTEKEKPAGLENELRNIFDPEEDEISVEEAEKLESDNVVDLVAQAESTSNRDEDTTEQLNLDDETSKHLSEEEENKSITQTDGSNERGPCCRLRCNKRRRFDSQFCSDACGVSVLEQDLLLALYDASEIHPSVLRLSYTTQQQKVHLT